MNPSFITPLVLSEYSDSYLSKLLFRATSRKIKLEAKSLWQKIVHAMEWPYPLSKKEFFLKLGVPKKLAKSLKTICEELRFYCICRLLVSNIKKTFSLVFPKGFGKPVYPLHYTETYTTQKMKFFTKDFFRKRN